MKNKKSNFIKLGIFLLGVSLLLLNCEKDTIIETQNHQSQINPTIKILSNKDNVGEVFNQLTTQFKLEPYIKSKQQANQLAKTTQNSNGVIIYSNQIKEVTLGEYTSYTMYIKTPNSNDSKFYNLTIEDKIGESNMFVTKYQPTENWLSNTKTPYEGNISTRMINDLEEIDESTEQEVPDSNNNSYNGGGGGSHYPTDCNGMVISTTVLTGYPCGCGHWPWQTCKGSTCGAPKYPGYKNVTTYECFGHTDSINTDNSNNNSNNNGGGNSIGNNNDANEGPDSITVLIGTGEVCEKPSPNDLNGDCKIDDYEKCLMNGNTKEACKCVKDGGTLEECKEVIEIFTGLDEFETKINDPNFDPLNDSWLATLRELAQKIEYIRNNFPSLYSNLMNIKLNAYLQTALTLTAKEYNPNVANLTETEKQDDFDLNGKKGVGILLYEFANGKGPEIREFSNGMFWNDYFEGDRIEQIKSDFEVQLNERGLTFNQFVANGTIIPGRNAFSPDHTNVVHSIQQHANANWVQFFVGGTRIEYTPSSLAGYIDLKMINPTSRYSLLLHQADEYKRINHGNIPLSTIEQHFFIRIKVR